MKRKMHDGHGKPVHPYVPEICEELRQGRVGRRDFLRTTTLLGVSAATAYGLAARITGAPVVRSAAAETPKSGGTVRMAMKVQEMSDPATFDWVEKSNVARGLVEYLVKTGTDNITRPYLAESWEASDDLKTWTFHLRQGVRWSNGDDFNADDVVYNFKRWLDPRTGSSNIGLFDKLAEEVDTGEKNEDGTPKMGKRMIEGAVEKVDDHTVRLHLKSPELAIPENLYNYPTAIVHRRFDEEGGDLSKNPVGTGPFELVDFAVGGKAVLRRRSDYWGRPAYVGEVHYIDVGQDPSANLAALASQQVDLVYEIDVTQLDLVERLPGAKIYEAVTAQTAVARMQVDQKPFDDVRVRRAVVACMDHQKLLDIAYRGRGAPGENHHVAPIHPEYAKLPPLKQDHALARQLLAEAGYADGLALTIDVGSTSGPWELACIQAFKEQCAPAGIEIRINTMPAAQYWEIWDKTPFGFTTWTHRPLGIMALNLGYRCGVPWNESRYCNQDFEAALDEAGATLDVGERRKIMARVQKILQEDAVIPQPLWRSVFSAGTDRVRGYATHPTLYHSMDEVWLA